MATDAKKHTTLAAGEAPRRDALARSILSISDVVPTANATEQAQVVAALAGGDFPVSAARPLSTTRGDARPLHQLEVTRDGVVFVPISGVLGFNTKAAADSWAQSNMTLLSIGDRCVAGTQDYRWNGSAWRGVLPFADTFVGSTTSGGIVTINHPLGAQPTAVSITDRNSGAIPAQRKIVKSGMSDTQVQFAVFNSTNGALLASNPVEFEYVVYP